MIEFSSGAFYAVTCELRDIRHRIAAENEFSNPDVIDDYTRHVILCGIIKDALQRLKERLAIIECPVTIIAIDEHSQFLSPGAVYVKDGLIGALDDIDAQLKREASAINLFALSYTETALFHPRGPLFNIEVNANFPSVSYEIDEAAKCLALSRSTASAFHSIRCLEVGIRALSRCLEIPDPTRGVDRSWMKALKAIKNKMEQKWPSSSIRTGGDDELFDNAYAALAAMQNPWRNDTMHLDQKYTPDEAKDIFAGVGAFMKKLASRMNEDGKPLA
jgi:hypothetical protein